jgi:hypothetical protein
MGLMARFQETLRRLAMIGEGFAGDAASPGSQDCGSAARGGAGGRRVTGWVPGMEHQPGAGGGRDDSQPR